MEGDLDAMQMLAEDSEIVPEYNIIFFSFPPNQSDSFQEKVPATIPDTLL